MDLKKIPLNGSSITAMVLTLLLLSFGAVFSQVSTPGTPISYGSNQQSNSRLRNEIFKLKRADIKKRIDNVIESNKAQRKADSLHSPMKPYGIGVDVEIDVLRDAELNVLPDGGNLHLIEIGSGGAYGLQLFFNRFRLPEGAHVYIYNKDKSMKLGAYTKANNNPNSEFAIQIIKGDTLVLEYYEPKTPEFKGELKVNKLIHVFSAVFGGQGGTNRSAGFGEAGSCMINVNCEPLYAAESKGIARIAVYYPADNISGFVSGSLINSVSQKFYLLTANHVYNEATTPDQYFSKWIFYFNYEHPGCSNSTLEPDITRTIQGAYLRSKGRLSDYILLEFSANPKSYYNVNYLGWDVTGYIPNSGVVGIHHPAGDVKKISLAYSEPIINVKVQRDVPGSDNDFDEVAGLPYTDFKFSWDEGVTQGGSSGSPLMDIQSRRIIGQLRGGNSVCTLSSGSVYYPGPDYYGMLATSWLNADSGYPTLKSLLAGSSSSITVLDGDYNGGPSNLPYVVIKDITLSTNAFELPKNKLVPTLETYGNTGTLNYEWTPTSDFSYPNLKEGVITFGNIPPTLPLTRTYTLAVIPQYGTPTTKSITVTLYDCQNRSISKNIHVNTDIELGKPGATGETYSWSPATNLSSSTIANPIFKSTTSGGFSYTMTAKSAGCTRTEKYGLYVDDQPIPTSLVTGIVTQKAQYASTNFFLGDLFGRPVTIKLNNGNYIVGTSYPGQLHDDDNQVELIKLDASFNVLLRKRFDTGFLNDVNGIKETSDGGFILTGKKGVFNSYGESKPSIAKVIKFDANLNPGWTYEKSETFKPDENGKLVTDLYFKFEDIIQTKDGGYAVIEFDHNYNDYPLPYGWKEYRHLIKLSSTGTYESYLPLASATNLDDQFYPRQLSDGSFIVVKQDATITKYNFMGSYFAPVWTKSLYDGVNANTFSAMLPLSDNTFVFAGGVNSSNSYEFRIVKMNSAGDILWDRRYGGSGVDNPASIIQLSTGGFLVGGRSFSPASGHKSENSRGGGDYWILKLDANGNNVGDNTYGGSGYDDLTNLFESGNGLYTLLGNSSSPVSGDKTVPLTSPNTNSLWWLQIQEGICSTPAATITASGPTFLCTTQSITLTANSGTNLSYKWHRNGQLVAQTQSITVTAAEPGEYMLTLMKPNSCGTTASTTISAYSVSISQSAGPFCAGGSTTLTANAVFPFVFIPTYKWQRKSTSWADVGTSTSLNVTTAGTYRVIATAGGCTFTSAERTVTPLSGSTPIISTTGDICANGFLTLTASSGASYLWSNGATARSISGYPGRSYYVKVSNSNGCSFTSGTYSVQPCNANPCGTSVATGRVPCAAVPQIESPIAEMTAIYPNPSDREITIYLSKPVDYDAPIQMYSGLGKVVNAAVLRSGENSITMDTRDLADGIYILQFNLKDTSNILRKVVVSHR